MSSRRPGPLRARLLRDRGAAVLFISHRLEEVFELCDRLTIMRNGETIVTKDVADSHIDEVISNMVGREAGQLPQRLLGDVLGGMQEPDELIGAGSRSAPR